ncbi:MAG: fumarylacetoacetate hydrolase family protein [Acidimicrobiia bacterium]|nr:fumarylacetoacetate hydrolase family protein [Acidimicrobiia bacterium]
MRLTRFEHAGRTSLGLVRNDEVVDLTDAGDVPRDMAGLLTAGPNGLEAVARAATAAPRVALGDVRLLAPVPVPGKFLAIGLNYADHVRETGSEAPEFPVFFNKQRTCVTGPFDPIHVPRASNLVDYEGELGVVIGRRCRHVPADRAFDVIAGYLVVNDVSVRDWQVRAPTMTLGKSFDTHGPTGPWLTTADEIAAPEALRIRTWLNGELRQDGNTSDMIVGIARQVEVLSTVFTLEPGDIISTGTPAGVGFTASPAVFLAPGDVVRIEVEGLGAIENPVIEEPPETVTIG